MRPEGGAANTGTSFSFGTAFFGISIEKSRGLTKELVAPPLDVNGMLYVEYIQHHVFIQKIEIKRMESILEFLCINCALLISKCEI